MTNKTRTINKVMEQSITSEVRFVCESNHGLFTLHEFVVIEHDSIKAIVVIQYDETDCKYQLWNYIGTESFFQTWLYDDVMKAIRTLNDGGNR